MMNRPTANRHPGGSDAPVHGTGEGHNAIHSIDLMYLFSVLRSNARLIALTTFASLVAMFVYLQFVPPVFTAYSQVILDTRKERVTPVEEVVSNLDVSQSVMAGEVITIRSNVLIGEVVDRLDLVDAPEFDPRLPRPESVVSYLKRIARGGEKPHVIAARLPFDTLRSWVIGAVRRDLGVSQIGVSYGIGISFRSTNPKLAAEIANAVADQYIESQLDAKMAATLRANAWLSDRLLELSDQVETADREVVDFKANMIEIANGSEVSINQLLAELNTKLVGSSTERADAEVRLSQVEMLEQAGGLGAVADVVTSPLLETLQRQRAELAAAQAQLASTLGRKHPEMIRISAQLGDIDRSIEDELRRRLEAMRSDVIVTRNREDALSEQIAVVSQRADSLAKASVRLSQLERTAQATRLVYENFLSRFKETSAQADFQTPEARVIGYASVPVVPSGPRKTIFMLSAMVLGMSAAIAFIFLRNLVHAPVSTTDELRAISQKPNVATVPYVRTFGKSFKWLRKELTGKSRTNYMDHVRAIRTHLFDVARTRTPRIVVVTSSVPNEGKTSLSCALAKVMIQPKKSVLLIDADLRRPDIRKALELPSEGNCLASYLQGGEKLKDLTVHSDVLGADVITPCRATQDPTNLLLSPLFEGLLNRMSSQYDYIVVNAPPVLNLADSVLLAKQADATLFAVQCGKTRASVARDALRRLEEGGVNVAGTVLTMVRRKDAASREVDMYSYGY
ncbi:GumC family protein [Sulfitobacter sabulilitoris]|uniref:non-specific protein-tyrosine kinase n=1 Tax=Sulfitobacter sabulilitoris TaxID=2562655 RepID=A0A5S3PBL7_9RHOB|nr:polysaccharide biosynthesis tyrosine autokinase [Sulfitobacter sabulilitoris]TMM51055.1 hypothetical protein FDT80_14385 [Sulfitobacter sabulilitoris]